MKHFLLFLPFVLLFAACSKDEFDPSKPKAGQVVELFVDHYRTGSDSRLFLNTDRKNSLATYVDKFDQREIGYTYVIKAKVVVAPSNLMDAPSYWFEYVRTVETEKYKGQDTFALPLFGFLAPSEVFFLRKDTDKYYYRNYLLSPADATVQADLAEALEKGPGMLTAAGPRSITLYVKHDPDNYGKGYVVYRVAL